MMTMESLRAASNALAARERALTTIGRELSTAQYRAMRAGWPGWIDGEILDRRLERARRDVLELVSNVARALATQPHPAAEVWAAMAADARHAGTADATTLVTLRIAYAARLAATA